MKVSINNKEIEASEAQVLLEGETLTLFEEGGKLFCKLHRSLPTRCASTSPRPPAWWPCTGESSNPG